MKKTQSGLIFLFVFLLSIIAYADETKDMGGWGINDPYNEFYDAGGVEKLKVVIMDVQEVIPLPGMSPGVALLVQEDEDDDPILVHVCPVWYKKPNRTGLRKGDKITLRGYFAEINDEEVIMASKIKIGEKSFKVRLTSDGTPFWTMTPAQLQKELSDE